MTREQAMQEAMQEADAFCDQYDVAPYGKTFSEFRSITLVNFFNKIYDDSLTTRIAELEELLKPKTCDECKWLDKRSESDFATYKCCNPIGGMVKWQKLESYCSDYEPKDSK